MKLKFLLILLFALGFAACTPRPEPSASSRAEAMKLCDDKLGEALDQIRDERKLWNSDRARYQKLEKEDFDKYLDEYYDTFKWTFLLDEEYEKINIIRGYCDPSPNKKFKDMWSVAAYVEYLSRPLDGSEESEVDRVYISGSSYSWDEPFRK